MDYTGLLELIRSRRSVRHFSDQSLERSEVEKLIEAARWAPSNHNRQGWRFVVIENRDQLREIAEEVRTGLRERLHRGPQQLAQHADETIHHATLFAEAPCVVLVMHRRPAAISAAMAAGIQNPELVSGDPLSAAMAAQNILLAAHALGLGACVMTAPLLVREAFDAVAGPSPGFEPTCLVALGYPGEDPPAPRRKRVEQIVEYR